MGSVKITNPIDSGAVIDIRPQPGIVNLQPGQSVTVGSDEANSLVSRYPFLQSEEIERPIPLPVEAPQPEVVSTKGKRKYVRKAKKD